MEIILAEHDRRETLEQSGRMPRRRRSDRLSRCVEQRLAIEAAGAYEQDAERVDIGLRERRAFHVDGLEDPGCTSSQISQ